MLFDLRIDSDELTLFGQDNTNHAFLQMEDRVLVYRGADQPDMSVINPESDVWQHIKAGQLSDRITKALANFTTDA